MNDTESSYFYSSNSTRMIDLPKGSYERVAALTRSYRQRLTENEENIIINHPVKSSEYVDSFIKEEKERRSCIEKEEENYKNLIMNRWINRSLAFASEFELIREMEEKKFQENKKRVVLEEQLYREQFLDFWKKNKQKSSRSPSDTNKIIMSAYKYNVLPFATDPVECWEKGIVIPPEFQQMVKFSDSQGTISLPPFHELSMKLRDAYNQFRAEQSGIELAKETAFYEQSKPF